MTFPRHDITVLKSQQRRLLFGGGLLLTLLTVLAAAGSILSGINDYHGRQRQAFFDGLSDINYFMAQRDRVYINNANVTNTLWSSRQDRLRAIGEPFAQSFMKNGNQVVVQSPGDASVPWLVLGLKNSTLPEPQLATYLGLIREYSAYAKDIVAATDSPQPVLMYAYVPSANLFAITNIKDKEQLLHLLRADTLEQAFDKLKLFSSNIKPSPTVLNRTKRGATQDNARVTFYGHNPLTGNPSLVTVMSLAQSGTPYITNVVFEPISVLGNYLDSETPKPFLVASRQGDIILENGAPPITSKDYLPEVLKASFGTDKNSARPARYSKDGAFFITAPVHGQDWIYIHFYTWKSIVEDQKFHFFVVTASALLMLIILWITGFLIDKNVLSPSIASASRIYESEELSRLIIETSPIGLCLLDTKSAELILQNRVVNDVIDTIDHDQQHALLSDFVSRANASGQSTLDYEWDKVASDGHHRQLQVSMVSTHYRDRQAWLCALHDVTHQKELEESLRHAKQQSVEAQEAAEAASRTKSAFVANMSHEIRTPLNGILGHLELLSRSRLDAAQRERLDRIRLSSDSLLAIINDVLDLSKIEAGQLDIELQPFLLRPLVEQVVLLFVPEATRKGLKLYFGIDPSLAQAYTSDVRRIRQILTNLLSNAIKFTESGRIALHVYGDASTTGESTRLQFEVVDSGIGMTSEQVHQLFQPFFQADASISRRFGGTGLGLALCKHLSQLLGGDIHVESASGVGSKFALEIPVGVAPSESATSVPPLKNMAVTLISASAEWRTEIGALLESWGAEVTLLQQPADAAVFQGTKGNTLILFGERRGWSDEEEAQLYGQYHRMIRALANGPLSPELRDGTFYISCYSSVALLKALTGDVAPTDSAPHDLPHRHVTHKGTVLLVDDHPVNRELIQQQLEMLGYSAVTAEDGLDALQKWVPDSFAAVLTDINMPRMNGYELAKALRNKGANIPILAITAAALASEKLRSKEAGMTDVLLKPLSLDQLDAMLARHIRRDASSQPEGLLKGVAGKNRQAALSAKLRQSFVDRGSRDLLALRQALEVGDEDALAAVVHSFKGALQMLGEKDLASACRAVEVHLESQGMEGAKPVAEDLVHSLENTLRAYSGASPN